MAFHVDPKLFFIFGKPFEVGSFCDFFSRYLTDNLYPRWCKMEIQIFDFHTEWVIDGYSICSPPLLAAILFKSSP